MGARQKAMVMSILSALLNPVSYPLPKRGVRKIIDGIEVKPQRLKSQELPKQITGRFATRSAQIRHEVIRLMMTGKTYTVMVMMREVDASETAVRNALEWLVDNSLANRQRGEGRYDYVEYWMDSTTKPTVKIKKREAPKHLIEHNRILHEQTFARYKAAAGGDWISTPDLQKALGISVNSGLKELKSWHEQEKIECRVMAGYESARRPRYEWRWK